jgi:type II secretory pathway pseudopilin PulG
MKIIKNIKKACPAKLSRSGGFTLIEAILYLAIAGTVLYFISGFAFNAIFGRDKIDSVQEVNQASRSILDDISGSISDTEKIIGITTTE